MKVTRAFAVVRPNGCVVRYTVRFNAKESRAAALECLTGAYSGETWKDIFRRGYRVRRVRVTVERK